MITSAAGTTFTVGVAGTFTVTATGTPTPTLSETGALPSGVSFDATSGVLAGTPASGTAGTYPITFGASNGVGPNASQSFLLVVSEAATTTTVFESPSLTTFGAPVTFRADVVPKGRECPKSDRFGQLLP